LTCLSFQSEHVLCQGCSDVGAGICTFLNLQGGMT